jgi:hypothetical protein
MIRLLLALSTLLLGCTRQPAPQILFPSSGATLTNPVHLEANTAVRWYLGLTRPA